MSPLYCALVHHPIRDRLGETVATAVTNFDVHDIARSARTYGLAGYYIVTPITAQRAIVQKIVEHWRSGGGRLRVPERTGALSLVEDVASLEDARAAIEARHRCAPYVLATSAQAPEGASMVGFDSESRALRDRQAPTLVVFGTGHGLTSEVIASVDAVLPPIRPGDYNHLSVRAAVAICLDRLVGESVSDLR